MRGSVGRARWLPQSFAPALGGLLLAVGAGDNYPVLLWTAGIIAVVGAAVVLPIKSVK